MELIIKTLTVDEKEATITQNKNGQYSAYMQDGDSEVHIRLSSLENAESEIESYLSEANNA